MQYIIISLLYANIVYLWPRSGDGKDPSMFFYVQTLTPLHHVIAFAPLYYVVCNRFDRCCRCRHRCWIHTGRDEKMKIKEAYQYILCMSSRGRDGSERARVHGANYVHRKQNYVLYSQRCGRHLLACVCFSCQAMHELCTVGACVCQCIARTRGTGKIG